MGAEEWCFGLIASTMFLQYNVYGHITLNTPVLVQSLKLSKVEPRLQLFLIINAYHPHNSARLTM